MAYFWEALGVLLLIVGYIGCFIPVLPGPVFAYAALWTLWLADPALPGAEILTCASLALVVVEVLDYLLPSLCAKRFHCTRWGVLGCFAGTLAGLFFAPWGIVLGPFLGALVGELIAGRRFQEALRGGFGALLGFALTFVLKFAACGLFTFWFCTNLPFL